MSDDSEGISAKTSLLVMLGTGVVLVAAMFFFQHLRDPDSWVDAWLDGDHLIVLELRDSEDSTDHRIAVLELSTGKRLESRSLDRQTAFAVVNGRLWLAASYRQPGFEAWDAKTLKTVITREQLDLQHADTSFCLDGTFARVTLKNGRFGTVDLSEGKVVQREGDCRGDSGRGNSTSGGVQGPRGWYGIAWETGVQRQRLVISNKERLGGTETFLEPQYLLDDGKVIEVEGDVLVVHRIELGENRALKLSRVGADAVRWTVPLGANGNIERVLFAEPSTLVVVAHGGIAVLDLKRGNALWRAGN